MKTNQESIRITVYGRPQQRGSKRAAMVPDRRTGGWLERNGKPVLVARDDNQRSTDWMQFVRHTALAQYRGPILTGPVELSARFYFARPASHYGTGRNKDQLRPSAPEIHAQTPDLAKLVRAVEDALSGVVWRDDRQIFRYGIIERGWTTGRPRCELEITPNP